jgi:hypothetical protein
VRNTMKPYRRLAKALMERRRLITRIDELVHATFPLGEIVHWELGPHVQTGEVVMVGNERLKVKNQATGKVFWVNLHRVLL